MLIHYLISTIILSAKRTLSSWPMTLLKKKNKSQSGEGTSLLSGEPALPLFCCSESFEPGQITGAQFVYMLMRNSVTYSADLTR